MRRAWDRTNMRAWRRKKGHQVQSGLVLSGKTLVNTRTEFVEILNGDVRVQIAKGTTQNVAARTLREVADAVANAKTYKGIMGH
jgi:uncharacterized cupin superfamily protein